MATPLRLDALIRVSQRGGRADDEIRSPTQQRDHCESWAAQNGARIVASHEGIGRSGKTMDRADINAALTRIKAGQTDGVIVAWLDRFSRAPTREALGVYDEFREAGGRVVAVDMAGLNPDDPTGEMALTVMLSVNRMQWRKIADRYKQTRGEAISEGKAVGGAPYGYLFTDPTPKESGRGVVNSRLVLDEFRAPIVHEVFERKAGGATWLELARWLDEVDPKPNGRKWARSSVTTIIRCRTYLGEVHSGEFVKTDAHPAIVDRALWRKAQSKPGRRTPRGTYLLSGLARCASCSRTLRGSTLGRKPRKGRKAAPPRVYTCDTPECQGKVTIVVNRLDAEVTEQFFAQLDAFHVRAIDDEEIQTARDEVERLTADVKALAMVRPKHAAAVEAHQATLTEAEQELVDAEDRLHELTTSLDADAPDIRTLREDWASFTLDEQREVLRAGLDAILVRRAPLPTAKPPTADRILVLPRGSAPVELNGGGGDIRTWTWDDDPSSLSAAA